MARPALDIANFFIEHSGYTKTQLQIQKMTYIAHGYMLAKFDKPFISDRVEAWDHGPVIPAIYSAFKKWTLLPIGKPTYRPGLFTDEESLILDEVFGHYGKYCGYYLSQITHEDGDILTPWKRHYRPGMNVEIEDQTTKDYYKELLKVK